MRGEEEEEGLEEEVVEDDDDEVEDDEDENTEDWFALFCNAEVPLGVINEVLVRACNGVTQDPDYPEWRFWLATTDWESAKPFEKHEDGTDSGATEPPVESFASPFIGQDLDSLAKALTGAPKEASLDRGYFAVLDERCIEDKSVVLCHIFDNGEVDWLRIRPESSSLHLTGVSMGAGGWNELKHSWNLVKETTGNDVLN